jgi:hypothetical protein
MKSMIFAFLLLRAKDNDSIVLSSQGKDYLISCDFGDKGEIRCLLRDHFLFIFFKAISSAEYLLYPSSFSLSPFF